MTQPIRRAARAFVLLTALLAAEVTVGRADGSDDPAIVAPGTARDDGAAVPAVVTFDEIDHVYAGGDVPPPGAFDRSFRAMPHASAPARKRGLFEGALRGLSVAGTHLDNAVQIVGASGQVGQTLHIAAGVAGLAPVASAMGLAGRGRFDALVETYVLPRVSPSGAQMLAGFLAARRETTVRYAHAPGTAPVAPDVAPARGDDPYARGSLRTYTLANTGRMRIDDPEAHVAIVFAPDVGQTYTIDDGNRTVHVASDAASLPRASQVPVASGSASHATALRSHVEALAATTLGGTLATGFHTHVVMNVRASGACTRATVTSDRVEYFVPIRIASTAANASLPTSSDARDACVPTGAVVSTGASIPAHRLLMYQANTIERTTASRSERYTLVVERGNLRTAAAVPSAGFEIPDGYRQI